MHHDTEPAHPIAPTRLPAPGPWESIAALVAWLDAHNGTGQQETALRLLKVTEEAGEAAAAYIGATGQNPRKGTTHTRADVADELCDVIVSAMVALHSFSDHPRHHLAAKLAAVTDRVLSQDTVTVAELHATGQVQGEVALSGTVTSIERHVSNAGYPWAEVRFTDTTGSIRVTFFPKPWLQLQNIVAEGLCCTVTGLLNAGNGELTLIGQRVGPAARQPSSASAVGGAR